MRKCLWNVLIILLLPVATFAQGGPTPGQGFHEDCQGTCTSTTGWSGADCWRFVVHPEHLDPADLSTGNCGYNSAGQLVCGEGTGQVSYMNGSHGSFGCTAHTCSFGGEFKCSNSSTVNTRSYGGGCASMNGSPEVRVGRDSATCMGDPGNSRSCACNGAEMYCATF